MFSISKKYESGVRLLNILNFEDDRGCFIKAYNKNAFLDLGIDFIPEEHFYSVSKKNVIRGMHFQIGNSSHNKIIHCIKGEILDVFVDLRKGSKTFNKPIGIKLNEYRNHLIFLPKGFAHGFLTLSDNSIVQYMTDKVHSPALDKGVLWNSIDFNWPIKNPLISKRDQSHPSINEIKCEFF